MGQPHDNPTTQPQHNQGFSAITLADLRWARCDIKSIALLPNVLMRQQAANQNATEAILLKHGNAVEGAARSEEHTSELQSRFDIVCRLLLDKKNEALPCKSITYR